MEKSELIRVLNNVEYRLRKIYFSMPNGNIQQESFELLRDINYTLDKINSEKTPRQKAELNFFEEERYKYLKEKEE